MYLFSFLSMSGILFVGCEQRTDLGIPVAFDSQTQTIGLPAPTNEEHVTSTSQEGGTEENDPFAEETFTISSSEMGKEEDQEAFVVNVVDSPDIENDSTDETADKQTSLALESAPSNLTTVGSQSFGTSWPIQLIGILEDASPKRATLRLHDGTEISVQAGAMLEQQGLVVLAVGNSHVSIARIIADGDVTTIEQHDLHPLY